MSSSTFFSNRSGYYWFTGKYYELRLDENTTPKHITGNYTNGNEYSDGSYGRVLYEKYTFYDKIIGNDSANRISSHDHRRAGWNVQIGTNSTRSVTRSWNDSFDDHFDGKDGNDALYGKGGSDTLIGGLGHDLLYSGSLVNGASDQLTGGPGSDTFFLGDSTLGESTVVSGSGVDWGNLALSLAGDVSDLAFTLTPGLGTIGKVTKEIVPTIFDVLKATSNEGETVVGPKADTAGSATITDFNPVEDVIIIPKPTSGTISLNENFNGDNLFQVIWDPGENDQNLTTDIIATVKLDDAFSSLEGNNDNQDIKKAWYSSLESRALIVDSEDAQDYKSNTPLQIPAAQRENLGNEFMVIGAHGEYEISGGNNGNYMYGTQHNDVIAGYESSSTAQTAGDDVMYGFAGDDEFAGGQGTDRIYGGDGSDTSNYAHSQAGINADLKIVGTNEYGSYAEVSDGFGTYDQLYSIENIVGSVYDDTIKGDDNANAFVGLGGNDTIYGEGGADIIDGGDGQDSLEGGNGADTIKGGDRPDYLDGGEGDDSLHGGAFKDTLIGGKDNDTLNGSWGRDLLKGGMGTDVLYGDHSHDTIYGEMGTDDLYGGEGNDILNGGKGYDTMTGGAGADTFILGGNSQKDIITDFNSDEGDTIDIDKSIYGFSSVSDLSFDGITGELKVSATGATIVTLENPVNFTFDDIYLDGVQNTDPLVVTGIIEEGTNGNDYLEGIHTPDILNGGEGNDTLIGYGGEDILTPGYGVDILTGGADADTFVFDVNERPTSRTANDNSTDFITDFSTGEDVIHIDKSAFGTHTDNITRRSLEFDYDSSSQSGVLSIGYLIGNYALETKIVTIENLASASEFNMGTDVQLV